MLHIDPFAYQSKTYRHDSKSIVATKEMMMKSSSEAVLKKSYVRKNGFTGEGHIFDVETLSETFGKGSATEKLNRDMNSLLREITVGTDATGRFEKIFNRPEVLDRWDGLKRQWKKEATREERPQVRKTIETVEENLRNGSFENEIAQQGALYFLFPGLYGSYNGEGNVVHRQLSKFLVTQPLPLKIEYRLVDPGDSKNPLVIEGTGEVDGERLDKRQLTKMIRTIKDRIDLKVELQVDYRERFEFDRDHWLNSATQNIKVKIPGFYMTESKQEMNEIESDGR